MDETIDLSSPTYPHPHPPTPLQDMWTEVTPGSILEVVYYRYLRFLPNGRLVYALLTHPPTDAVKLFREWEEKSVSEQQAALQVSSSFEPPPSSPPYLNHPSTHPSRPRVIPTRRRR